MNRRAFLAALSGSLLAAPLTAEAQARPRVARVAFLEAGGMGSDLWQVTRDGLRELGYVEGQNLSIDLKTAKALGLTIPQSLLLRADRVIE